MEILYKLSLCVPDSVNSLTQIVSEDYAVQSVHRRKIKLGIFIYEDKIMFKDF